MSNLLAKIIENCAYALKKAIFYVNTSERIQHTGYNMSCLIILFVKLLNYKIHTQTTLLYLVC